MLELGNEKTGKRAQTKANEKLEKNTVEEVLSVYQHVWEELMKTVKKLTIKQKEMKTQNTSVCGLFKQGTQRLEVVENKCKQSAALPNNTDGTGSNEQLRETDRGLKMSTRVEQEAPHMQSEIGNAANEKRTVGSSSKK